MNFAIPDYGMVTMTEQVEIIKRINDATSLPLICDLDDGYGSAINVYRTIKEVSRLDVARYLLRISKIRSAAVILRIMPSFRWIL